MRGPRVVDVSGCAESHAMGRDFKSADPAGSATVRPPAGSRVGLGVLECRSSRVSHRRATRATNVSYRRDSETCDPKLRRRPFERGACQPMATGPCSAPTGGGRFNRMLHRNMSRWVQWSTPTKLSSALIAMSSEETVTVRRSWNDSGVAQIPAGALWDFHFRNDADGVWRALPRAFCGPLTRETP